MATEPASERITVTITARNRLRDFKNGFNRRYTEAIMCLIDEYKREGESDFEAGRRLSEEIESRG